MDLPIHPFARVLSHKKKSLTKNNLTPTKSRVSPSKSASAAIGLLSNNNHRKNDLFHHYEYCESSISQNFSDLISSNRTINSIAKTTNDGPSRTQKLNSPSSLATNHKENTPGKTAKKKTSQEDKAIFYPPNPSAKPIEPAALDPSDPRCYFYVEPPKPDPVLERSRINVKRILAKRTEKPVPSPLRDDIIPIPRNDLMADLVFYVDSSADHSKKFIKDLKHPTAVANHLKKMGATIKKTLCNSVTHVLFNNGGRSVYEFAMQRKLEIVGIAWIEKCKELNKVVPAKECPAANIDLFKDPDYKKRPNLSDDEKASRREKIASRQEFAEIHLHEVALKVLRAKETEDWKIIEKCYSIHQNEHFAGPHRAMRRNMRTVLTPFKLDINICKAIIQKHELAQQQDSSIPSKKSKKSLCKTLDSLEHSQSNTSADNSLISLSGIEDTPVRTTHDSSFQDEVDSSKRESTIDRSRTKDQFLFTPPAPVCRKRCLDTKSSKDQQMTSEDRYDTPPAKKICLAPRSTSTPYRKNTSMKETSTKENKSLSKPSEVCIKRNKKSSTSIIETKRTKTDSIQETSNLSESLSWFAPNAKAVEKTNSQTVTHTIKLCFTGLNSDQQKKIMRAVRKLGGCKIYGEVEPDVTHVICTTERNTSPTLNVLKGLLNNCWVLSYRWVQASLKKGNWERESKFVQPRYSAAMKILKKENVIPWTKCSLLHCVGSIYIHVAIARAHDYQTLVRLAGGQVSHDFHSADIIVGTKEIKFTMKHECVVSTTWLIDTICAMKVKPFNTYLL